MAWISVRRSRVVVVEGATVVVAGTDVVVVGSVSGTGGAVAGFPFAEVHAATMTANPTVRAAIRYRM